MPDAIPPPTTARVLYCRCAYAQVVPKDVKDEVLQRLAESDVAFDAVADLCEMSARKDPALARLAQSGGTVTIAACYPRAVKWMFAGANAPLPKEGVRILNMRVESAETVVDAILNSESAPEPEGEAAP